MGASKNIVFTKSIEFSSIYLLIWSMISFILLWKEISMLFVPNISVSGNDLMLTVLLALNLVVIAYISVNNTQVGDQSIYDLIITEIYLSQVIRGFKVRKTDSGLIQIFEKPVFLGLGVSYIGGKEVVIKSREGKPDDQYYIEADRTIIVIVDDRGDIKENEERIEVQSLFGEWFRRLKLDDLVRGTVDFKAQRREIGEKLAVINAIFLQLPHLLKDFFYRSIWLEDDTAKDHIARLFDHLTDELSRSLNEMERDNIAKTFSTDYEFEFKQSVELIAAFIDKVEKSYESCIDIIAALSDIYLKIFEFFGLSQFDRLFFKE